jgi:hypothetical protein
VKLKQLISVAREIASPYCVRSGKKLRLKDADPGDAAGYTSEDKPRAKQALARGVEALSAMQETRGVKSCVRGKLVPRRVIVPRLGEWTNERTDLTFWMRK